MGALMPRCHWSLTCTFREEGVVLHLGQFYATVLFFNKALCAQKPEPPFPRMSEETQATSYTQTTAEVF